VSRRSELSACARSCVASFGLASCLEIREHCTMLSAGGRGGK
jgi:hypothetical protein